jgi:hypothetical protein
MNTGLDRYRAEWDEAYQEVRQLHVLRYVWKNLVAMLQARGPDLEHNTLVNNWLTTCYSRTLAVGIRRQTDPNGPATIGSLLRRIQKDASLFTRESCAFDLVDPCDAHRDAWLRYANSPADPLSADRLAGIEEELRADATAARKWVDKRVAHLAPGHSEVRPTFGDLEEALAGLRDAMKFLYPLFNRGANLANATPTCGLEWMGMFSKPWYVSDTMRPVDAFSLG